MKNHELVMVFDAARTGQEWERRFYLMIELCSPRRGGIGFLSEKTGISERRWKNVMLFKQKPAVDMALALAWLRPELARWMWTGSAEGPNSAPAQSEIDLINEARLLKVRRSPNPDMPDWLRHDLDQLNQNWATTPKSQSKRSPIWSEVGPETSLPTTDQPDQPDDAPPVAPNW